MAFTPDNNSLLLDQDTIQFLMYEEIELHIFYSTIKEVELPRTHLLTIITCNTLSYILINNLLGYLST